MKRIFNYSAIIIAMAAASCSPNMNNNKAISGNADFTKYVAIGNSLCAGYTDGGLSYDAQQNSFPRMLAQQMLEVGGAELKTPWMDKAGNGNNGQDMPMYTLVMTPTGPAPVQSGAYTSLNDNATVSAAGPYTHLGIPGCRAVDFSFNGYGNFNKFLGRIVTSPTNSLLDEALKTNASFFSYWLGSNDVLLWAVNGGADPIQTAPGFALPGTLMHPSTVQISIQKAIDTLTFKGAKGVIANVPDVSSTPYFTTIPYNAVVLTRQGQVDSLNMAYASYNSNAAAAGKAQIVWSLGQNAVVIADTSASGFLGRRKATPADLICLSAASILTTGAGSATPLADKYVLDAAEVAIAQSYTDQYNTAIKNIADAKGLAFVDANSFLKTFKSGMLYNGVTLAPTFVTGGGFGLDGVHPTPRGYALIANEFIKAINAKYGSTLKQVDALKYRSVPLP